MANAVWHATGVRVREYHPLRRDDLEARFPGSLDSVLRESA